MVFMIVNGSGLTKLFELERDVYTIDSVKEYVFARG